MQSLQEIRDRESPACTSLLPISVIVPVRNEARNLPRCLESLRQFGEVYVIDSQSSDESVELARTAGAKIVQFYYQGGWPKKRQWALNTLPLKYEWVLLLDADEVVTPSLAREIRAAISDPGINGYHLGLQMWFLGRPLRFSGARFWKTSLFRREKGRFECRLAAQDSSMADMEIHEHVIVDGPTTFLKEPLIHHNVDSLSRYIRKHDEYSNWESEVLSQTLGPEDSGEFIANPFEIHQHPRHRRRNLCCDDDLSQLRLDKARPAQPRKETPRPKRTKPMLPFVTIRTADADAGMEMDQEMSPKDTPTGKGMAMGKTSMKRSKPRK